MLCEDPNIAIFDMLKFPSPYKSAKFEGNGLTIKYNLRMKNHPPAHIEAALDFKKIFAQILFCFPLLVVPSYLRFNK